MILSHVVNMDYPCLMASACSLTYTMNIIILGFPKIKSHWLYALVYCLQSLHFTSSDWFSLTLVSIRKLENSEMCSTFSHSSWHLPRSLNVRNCTVWRQSHHNVLVVIPEDNSFLMLWELNEANRAPKPISLGYYYFFHP